MARVRWFYFGMLALISMATGWHEAAAFDPTPHRSPAGVNTVDQVPLTMFGDLCVYGVSPDFQPGNEIQIDNANPWRKIKPKKSWEIEHNYFGGSLPRLPGTADNEFQYYQPVHLIDGDERTCWISRSLPLPDVEPQWVRIDLPQEREIASVVMKARGITFPERGFDNEITTYTLADRYKNPFPKQLVVEVSRDNLKWETVYETQSLVAKGQPGEMIRLDFKPVRAKSIRLRGRDFGNLIGWVLGPFFGHCWCMSAVEALTPQDENLALASRGAMVAVSSTCYGYQGRRQEMNDLWPCIYDLGFKWLRLGIWGSCLQWHYVEREKGKYVIDPAADAAVTQAAANGITIIMGLEYGNWLYGDESRSNLENLVEPIPYDSPPAPRSPAAVEGYCNFVRFMVNHFKGRVKYWEIWNEPGASAQRYGFGNDPKGMADYLNLFKQVEPLIRQIDPEAKLLTALMIPEVIQKADAFDAYRLYNNLLDKVGYEKMFRERAEALAAGNFKGLLTSEENQWNVSTLFELGVTEIGQAKNLARTLLPHAAHGVAAFWNETWDTTLVAGPTMFMNDVGLITPSDFSQPQFQLRVRPGYYMYRTLCTATAEAKPGERPVECSLPDKTDLYTMALPDGGFIAFAWLRGNPVDDHPGEKMELRLPGARAASITGIDTLNGREKDLRFEQRGDATVIPDLIVRDYPLILKITNK